MTPTILITGGLGYLGAHLALRLIEAGMQMVIVDNLSNAREETYAKLVAAAVACGGNVPIFEKADVTNLDDMCMVFLRFREIRTVYHFAGLKSVPKSIDHPLDYYFNNVVGLLNLLTAGSGCINEFVFSSSAAVYLFNGTGKFTEEDTVTPITPYGQSKIMSEQILESYAHANPGFHYAALRYFNPIGADPKGRIGEEPVGPSGNLMPNIELAAVGVNESVNVFGMDHETHDGTAMRDYVHVVDLIDGHIKAANYLYHNRKNLTVNLGTGTGYTVKEVIEVYQVASGTTIKMLECPRRQGDVPVLIADPSKAKELLDWRPRLDLFEACRDSWNYIQKKTGI